MTGQVQVPQNTTGPLSAVIYLKNLPIPRLGKEPDEPIIADLLKEGDLVVVLDYQHDPRAVSPAINLDILKLRTDIRGKEGTPLLADYKVDLNHIFILFEGFRLKRDVEFARDGSRALGMDIFYPSQPAKPVPALLEITCDNTNRMGNFSLLFCHDTLVEGAQAAGFAAAMIDHPVPPPYKGIDDPMPQAIYRLKAAVRTLRSLGPQLGLSGQIGAIGFSRGGPMAALLAVTGGRADLDGDGPHPDVSSRVQAALIHGNYYDYTKIPSDDRMFKRFQSVWGPRDKNPDRWAMHGAPYYLTKDVCPMFLDTSAAESKEFRAGLAAFHDDLTALGIPHIYEIDPDQRGHQVTTDPKILKSIYDFFHQHLN